MWSKLMNSPTYSVATKQKTNEVLNQPDGFFKKEMRVTVACTLPISIAYQVESLSEELGVTKSQVMQDLVTKGLSLT